VSTQKTLTIAIPTYNRGIFLQENLSRVLKQVVGFENEIEILVSDNCSIDNTQSIIQDLIYSGAPIIYNRNNENIGMDGNFIYCFKNASAKYVWLLSDDDHLVEGSLPRIVNLLKEENYGLVHLSNARKKNSSELEIFTDFKKFTLEINFYLTFISGNIVKTKNISTFNFANYYGTLIVQTPLYLTSALCEHKNLILRFNVLEPAADAASNGGYNIFEVFVTNYLNILNEFKTRLGVIWYEKQKYLLFRGFVWGWLMILLINSNHSLRFKTNKWFKIIFLKFWYEPYYFPLMVLFWFKKLFK
jgi:glycosyltransferase involved in cell wall biosynthesis